MKNNKGLSLVELIIAFALLAIVGVAANGLLGSGSRLFKNNAQELDLQNETQSALNHLNNLIVDTQRGIYFDVSNPDEKVLQIYNNDKVYHIKWKPADKCIYYAEQILNEDTIGDEVVLISGVEDFSVNLDKVDADGKVAVYIKLVNADRDYEGTQTFSLRNDIKNTNDIDKIREEVSADLGSYVETVVISSARTYCAKGGKYQFTASVRGENYPISSVTWKLDTSGLNGTTIDEKTGMLEIGEYETNTTITITATSVGKNKEDEHVSASTEIKIVDYKGIKAKYEEDKALVGSILKVEGWPEIQNQSLLEGDPFAVDFRLPTAADIEKYKKAEPAIELKTCEGIGLVKSDQYPNECSLFLYRKIEEDEYIAQSFADNGYAKIHLIMTCPSLDVTKESIAEIVIKPSNISDIDINGRLIVDRGSTSSLSAKVLTQGIDNRDVTITWAITKDAGLGKAVSIDSEKGILTVNKDVDFNKEFKIEVTATATAETKDSVDEMKTTVTVVIPKVTISLDNETVSVNKGNAVRIPYMVNGLVTKAEDVICSSKPSMKNTLMYCTASECVVSVGAKETKDIVAINVMLKQDTSISKSITLYVLSKEELYNVECRKNVYAEYFTPEKVGKEKVVTLEDKTRLVYTVENQKTVLTVGTIKYDYAEDLSKDGITGWWIPRSNVVGKDYYIPVPGLAPNLPDEITTLYKLSFKGLSLTYSSSNGRTFVQVLNEDDSTEYFVLSQDTGERWIAN